MTKTLIDINIKQHVSKQEGTLFYTKMKIGRKLIRETQRYRVCCILHQNPKFLAFYIKIHISRNQI